MSGLGEWDDEPSEDDDPTEAPGEATPAKDPEPQPSKDDDAPKLKYPSLDVFVRDYVCQVFRRRVADRGPYRWDARWWESAEALIRLEAMWRAFEVMRHEYTGMSTWLKDIADPQMEALWNPEGPFKYATSSNEAGAPLPYEEPPATLFSNENERPLEGETTEGG